MERAPPTFVFAEGCNGFKITAKTLASIANFLRAGLAPARARATPLELCSRPLFFRYRPNNP
eukprot:3521138-Prymnesium_polylepis.1